VTQRLDDASVAARVKQALARNRSLRGFNFSPTVVHGHLVLRGDVDTRSQYRRAERAAAALRGVDEVTNRITVEGRRVSTGDNTTSDTAPTYHRVRGGDTLWHIAREYEVSVERIRALNDDLSSLQPGDRIRVQ
jgi:LysM repeat protein